MYQQDSKGGKDCLHMGLGIADNGVVRGGKIQKRYIRANERFQYMQHGI